MGLFSRDLKSLDDLFAHGLKDIYYVENQIVKNLPKMIEAASDAELRRSLKDHLVETELQVQRLEQVFELLNEDAEATRCPGIDGILSEGDDVLGNVEGHSPTNAAVVASAQAVEHYEITRYGTLIAWATELGKDNIVPLLQRNLREEKAADKKLSAIAEARVNKGVPGGTARRRVKRKATRPSAKARRPPAKRRAS